MLVSWYQSTTTLYRDVVWVTFPITTLSYLIIYRYLYKQRYQDLLHTPLV